MRCSRLFKNTFLLTTALTCTIVVPQAKAEGPIVTLDAITIIATKTKDAVIDTLSGTSVVGAETLERTQPSLISEVLNGVPGVEVQEDTDNPGTSINIRGLQDFGRVNVMIDGARQNFQASGHGANGTFYLDPELIKTVDIVRGPVSAIYGSGAIAGVVNFELIEAQDVLYPGEKWAIRQKLSYATNDKEFLSSSTFAFMPVEEFGILGNVIFREDKNYKGGNGNRIFNSGENVLSGYAKASLTPSEGNILKLGYLQQRDRFTTGTVGTQRDTITVDKTATLKWLFEAPDNPWIDIHLSTYGTSTRSSQSRLDGVFAGNQRNFEIQTYGIDLFNTSTFDTGTLSHKLTYGGDFFKDTVKTNDPGNTGDEFTPSGTRDASGLFIQDQVEVNSWLKVTAALRYDTYELDGTDNNANTPVNITDSQFSPKATIAVTPFAGVEIYGTYADAYRAPAITETLNSGLHDVPGTFGDFTFLPNAGLKPETAHNFEIGTNLKFDEIFTKSDKFRAKFTAYHNEVDDFINQTIVGFSPAPGALCTNTSAFFCLQYQNVAKARLQGVEIEADYDAGFAFAKIAYTYTDGKDLITKEPLASVRPHKLVTTAGMRFMEERLVAGVTWTTVGKKKRKDLPAATGLVGALPEVAAYNVVDLFATYEHNRYLSTSIRLKNVLDENYTKHLNLNASEGFSALFSVTMQLGG